MFVSLNYGLILDAFVFFFSSLVCVCVFVCFVTKSYRIIRLLFRKCGWLFLCVRATQCVAFYHTVTKATKCFWFCFFFHSFVTLLHISGVFSMKSCAHFFSVNQSVIQINFSTFLCNFMLSRIVVRALTFKWICSWCTRYSFLFLFLSLPLSLFLCFVQKNVDITTYFLFRIFMQLKYSIEFNWNTCKHSNKFMLITLIFTFAHCATFQLKPMRKKKHNAIIHFFSSWFHFVRLLICYYYNKFFIYFWIFCYFDQCGNELAAFNMGYCHIVGHITTSVFVFCFRLVRITN